MCDEIRNNGTELNEAVLSGVSGGSGMDDFVDDNYCDRCDCRNNCGPHGSTLPQAAALIRYIKANGKPKSYRECPNYNA